MFSLSNPSTIEWKMPSWTGAYKLIGGGIKAVDDVIYDGYKAIVDPVKKEAVQLEQSAVTAIVAGKDYVFSSVGNAAGSAARAIGSVVSPLFTPIKWAIFLIIIGLALYAFLIAQPFLPKPGGKR